jgi:hypothetical protein
MDSCFPIDYTVTKVLPPQLPSLGIVDIYLIYLFIDLRNFITSISTNSKTAV